MFEGEIPDKRLFDGLIAYITAAFIVAIFISVKDPLYGTLQLPSIHYLTSNFSHLISSNLIWGVAVLAIASFLRNYTERFNWLISGIGIGLFIHLLTISSWKLQGISGPQLATYSRILGTGLKIPTALGITGQLTQRLALGSRTIKFARGSHKR